MSFDIKWELLKSGIESDQLKSFLNARFEAIDRPSFLGPIEIKSFDFGTMPPEIAVENISDPLEDFYLDLHLEQHIDSLPSDSIHAEESSGSQKGLFESGNSENHHHQIVKSATDCQVEISIKYKGDMSMCISTELIINQPTPGFMSLPLILTLTKSSFQGTFLFTSLSILINS